MAETRKLKVELYDDCPTRAPRARYCRCGKCKICGAPRHSSMHGPYWKGEVVIMEPYGGHEFQAIEPEVSRG